MRPILIKRIICGRCMNMKQDSSTFREIPKKERSMVAVTVETVILRSHQMGILWHADALQTVKWQIFLKIVWRMSGSVRWKNTEILIDLQNAGNVS